MKPPDLTEDQVFYLRGLVRVSIRKQRKTVAGFGPHPGQDPDEAAEVLARFRDGLAFREGTYQALGGHLKTLTMDGGDAAPGSEAGYRPHHLTGCPARNSTVSTKNCTCPPERFSPASQPVWNPGDEPAGTS
jgi:hypothetical protein